MINLFAAVVQRFGHVDVRLAALAVGFHLANHVLRSVAWRNVLASAYPDRRVRLLDIGATYPPTASISLRLTVESMPH